MASPAAARAWRGRWAGLTAIAGVIATALDAALLQRKWNYFTGGFLAPVYTATWSDVAQFFAGSLAADIGVLGIAVALSLWLTARVMLSATTAALLVLACALLPVLAADVITYEVVSFFGTGFDLALMFDLVSNRPLEFVAVLMSRVSPALLAWAATGSVSAVAGAWMARRWWTHRPLERAGLHAMWTPAVVALVGGVLAASVLRLQSETLNAGLARKASAMAFGPLLSDLTDFDRDGYSIVSRLVDPDPRDPRIHPYALDVPGNGVDEDGVGGDLPLDAPPYVERGQPAGTWTSTPPVLLILLESVRADIVGTTYAGTPVTPNLDAIAARGVRVSQAYSHNGFTVQSRWHMFSGSVAGLRGSASLVDDFRERGYETAYFSGQNESFGGAAFDVAFSRAETKYDARDDVGRRYTTFATSGTLAVPGPVVVGRVQEFLRRRRPDRPLFLYVNLHDSHYPYSYTGLPTLLRLSPTQSPDITPSNARQLRATYANAVANADRHVGELVRMMTTATGQPPAVVVLSDHGESLFDDGYLGHGFELNVQQTRIPLIVAGLPLVVAEPFGQAELRDAIVAALAAPHAGSAPRSRVEPGKQVFQYLGMLNRPGQIALRGASNLVAYDFRRRQVRVDGGQWVPPATLDHAARARLQRLIEHWESMMLAKNALRASR